MKIYLADLVHNYFPGLNTVPLNIAYIAAYSKSRFSNQVEFQLFKYTDELLEAIDKEPPSLVGLSNYMWNYRLNGFVGRYIKRKFPRLPIVMGGPNIRNDKDGIANFLNSNEYVDIYCLLEGEIPFSCILEALFNSPESERNDIGLKKIDLDSCFSYTSGRLNGRYVFNSEKDLDYIPSPYTSGLLDIFLESGLVPLLETTRGCPYECSYCNWGASVRKRMKSFSLERVKSEMDHVANKGIFSTYWTIADSNLGILKRDIEIARYLREIYDKKKPFNKVETYWDKSGNDFMLEIAKILKGISNAYVAFQTFDPFVQKMTNRKNISIEKFKVMAPFLCDHSERFHTDILLSLPGETLESHLNSLKTAFNLGFDDIGGGEVRLLWGSDLETDESRNRFELKTKFRLGPEGFGIYRGEFVFELEEDIRSTKWISEDEMIKLRVLRAIFFGSIAIGEHLPLMKYLRDCGVNVIDLFQKIIETRYDNSLVKDSIDWLIDKAHREWFDSPQEAERFFSNETNRIELLKNPVVKLNFDFLSSLILSDAKYIAFNEFMFKVISNYFPQGNREIAQEILMLCEKRNYIRRCFRNEYNTEDSIELSYDTIKQLEKMGYVNKNKLNQNTITSLKIAIKENMAKFIHKYLIDAGSKINIQTITMIIQKTHSNIYLEARKS